MAKSGTVENFSIGYQDYLQAPLQVRDHYLHLIRGQRPERVPFFSPWRITCKARHIRLLSKILSSTPTTKRRHFGLCWSGRKPMNECALATWSNTFPRADPTFRLLCVAGAGRGPLVARALKAISRAKRKAFIHAVEKNPNAFVT